MLPAYVPNPVAAATGGGAPIDFGRNWRDNKRIFGDGKTWRGFIVGVLAGVLVGAVQVLVAGVGIFSALPPMEPLPVVLLATGALLGDLVKSFFKRRLGKERGASWPVFDQYDLVAGSLVLVAVLDPSWAVAVITPAILIAILIITPVLHRAVNIIGYVTGVKDVPW